MEDDKILRSWNAKNNSEKKGSSISKNSDSSGSIINEWSSVHNKDKESNDSNSKKNYSSNPPRSFRQQWKGLNRQLKSIRKEAEKNLTDEEGQTLNSVSRVVTYNLYVLAWRNIIDSFGATFIYLIWHFTRKYLFSDQKYCHFVDPLNPSMTALVASDQEKPHYGWILMYIVLYVLLVFLLALAFLIIISPFALVVGYTKEFLGVLDPFGNSYEGPLQIFHDAAHSVLN